MRTASVSCAQDKPVEQKGLAKSHGRLLWGDRTGAEVSREYASRGVSKSRTEDPGMQVQGHVHVACPTLTQGPELGLMCSCHCVKILNDF